ncbi:MAG: bifunctional tRNA (5-methylaminomethyl-2-thiouridine)(34)-methyltransferase MnmD/FAD-dependent 5-carboxymethylaminomethyl-2-thiouridine(34) oxidoreductase MnmC [Pasteurellaceae bacterium]|nr:bifunctional tRNA (5-methylaminomethyl-2-thiouridine)(34)-methyltransferase MnmD/FAD-dependent 5-carboxymethylaminomethyl-2-thiouridine(34) oxidoreductase MnmC [Pasteurellaceae bacterium]
MKISFASLSFNGSNTPVSEQFDDIYFSTQDGLAESQYVFQEGNQLWQKWQSHHHAYFVIAETGFGTGLNFFAVEHRFRQFRQAFPHAPLKRLYFISFEKYPLKAEQFAQVHRHHQDFAKSLSFLPPCWKPKQTGCQRYHFDETYLDVWFGDLTENLPQLGDYYNNSIDCWFLDGFAPDKNPEMWNDTLYQQMFRLTRNGGSFATFTAASAVRKGLQQAGFVVNKRKGFGKKREMLWGEKPLSAESSALAFPYFYQQNQTESNDIAIVGGGVASLFLAWSLLEKGKNITLYCQDNTLAHNASGNRQGAIYPQLSDDDNRNIRFYLHSIDYALQRLRLLAKQVEFDHDFSGVALYAYNDKTAQKLEKIAAQGWDQDVFTLCNSAELSEKIGLPVTNGGAFIAQGGWLSPIQLVQNGFTYLQRLGLNIVLNHQVSSPVFRDRKWHWQHQGNAFAHDTLVLANGHRLTDFPQAQGIPLYPVRGQVSHLPSNAELEKLKTVICFDGYLTPKAANYTHCLGASHIRDNATLEFSLAEHQQNFAKTATNLPPCHWVKQLDSSHNQGRVGIRAALRDRVPMVGAMPNFNEQKQQFANLYNQLRRKEVVTQAECYPNLYLIAGLSSRGLTTAPLLGELLASQICGEPMPISEDIRQALSTNRTWIRSLLRGKTLD